MQTDKPLHHIVYHEPRKTGPLIQRLFFLLAYFLVSVSGPLSAYAGTYYVWADRGNDHNAGDSWDNAWKSLVYAGKQANPGDTVIIRKSAKPYRYLHIVNSGTPDNPITFRGESATDPPVLAGARQVSNWSTSGESGVWRTKAKRPAYLLIEDGKPVLKASSSACTDGRWFWGKGILFYRPMKNTPDSHVVWRQSSGGGISIGRNSWITVENLYCWISWGACISIKGGHHNIARRIRAKWCWRGVDITDKANHNLIEDALVEENREGIYVRLGSSYNTVRKCTVLHNGNPPLYTTHDRHAIGLGARGISRGNIIEDCEIAYNGGPPDNGAVVVFRAPETTLLNNHIHDNYGSAVIIALDSHGSIVSSNRIIRNGEAAVQAGSKGVVAVAVRNSKSVSVIDNYIENNHVSPDSIWHNQYRGPHGALDIDSTVQAWKRDMSGIRIENNIVTGTIGGPDIHISRNPDLSGITVIPAKQAPSWLHNAAPSKTENQAQGK